MDGVIADFVTSALARLNANSDQPPITAETYATLQEFDMAKVFGVSTYKFWQTIETNNFWANLAPMPHASLLLSKLRETNIPIVIASSPSFHASCVPSKIAWLYYHFGINITDCMFGRKKHLMANPGTLLIDDLQKNVAKFIFAGGQAVCVPSNWNTHNLTFSDIWSKIEPQL